MPHYEVKDTLKGRRSVWNGAKENGHRVLLKAGAQVELSEEAAEPYKDHLVAAKHKGVNLSDGDLAGVDHNKAVKAGVDPDMLPHSPTDGQVLFPTANAPVKPAVESPKLGGNVATDPAPLAAGDDTVTEEDLADLLESNGVDVIATVKSMDDVEQLRTLKSAEKKGKGRSTVMDAIDRQIESVKDAE